MMQGFVLKEIKVTKVTVKQQKYAVSCNKVDMRYGIYSDMRDFLVLFGNA